MSNTNLFALDMAALNHTTVMQGHADYCAAHGHATYTGTQWDTELCPRCGALTTPPVQDHTAHNAGNVHNLIECTHPECASYTAPAVQAPATVPAPPIYPLAFILDMLLNDGFDGIEAEWYWSDFPNSYAQWEQGAQVDRYGAIL